MKGSDTMDTNDKLTRFADTNNISVVIESAKANPSIAHWTGAKHFKVKLRRSDEWAGSRKVRQLTVYYSQGSALPTPPSIGAIVNAIVDDVLSWAHYKDSFEWYAAEFCGVYPETSNDAEALATARRRYNIWGNMVRRAEIFFGPCLLGSVVEIMNGEEDPETWDDDTDTEFEREAC